MAGQTSVISHVAVPTGLSRHHQGFCPGVAGAQPQLLTCCIRSATHLIAEEDGGHGAPDNHGNLMLFLLGQILSQTPLEALPLVTVMEDAAADPRNGSQRLQLSC